MAGCLVSAYATVPRQTCVPSQSGHRRRATRRGKRSEVHGKVIAELGFGFWRYLYEPPYLTSLQVPAFALHPSESNPPQVRSDVADRMQRLHFLPNRIAHHEPIHRRDLAGDSAHL